MSDKLISSYEIKLSTPECRPGSDRYRALVRLQMDISEVLPYLNAELNVFDYFHENKILICGDRGKIYALRPCEIAIAPVLDSKEALKLAEGIVDRINAIWNRRNEIRPDYEGRRPPPGLLKIYKLLPGTNCKECGFLTCMAFAASLRNDAAKSSLCPHLDQEEYLNMLASG